MTDIFTPLEIVTEAFRLFRNTPIEVKEDEDDIYENQAGKAILIDGWVYLVPMPAVEERKSILGTTKHDAIHYDVEFGYVIPGRRYYPDGSGEPDDYDVQKVGADLELPDAIKLAWQTIINNEVDSVLTNLGEHAMAIEDGHTTKEEVLT